MVDKPQLQRPDNVGVKLLDHGHEEELVVAQLFNVVLLVGCEQRLLVLGAQAKHSVGKHAGLVHRAEEAANKSAIGHARQPCVIAVDALEEVAYGLDFCVVHRGSPMMELIVKVVSWSSCMFARAQDK